MATSELGVIGLTCNVVGVFFLANSIRFREPKKALEESLGVGARSLDKAQDTALNTMQVVIGFLFLTTGFLLQLVASWGGDWIALGWCGGIVVFAVAVPRDIPGLADSRRPSAATISFTSTASTDLQTPWYVVARSMAHG